MKISSLQPQFFLQSHASQDAAQDRKRSRDSGADQHSKHDADHNSDSNDPSKSAKTSQTKSGQEQGDSDGDSHAKSHDRSGSVRDGDWMKREPLRMSSITTADLAAALAPERLFASDPGSAVSNQTSSKDSKKSAPTDPVADVLRRLAFQTAEDSFKKLHALSAYTKVRDAMKPPALPSLKMLANQAVHNEGASLNEGTSAKADGSTASGYGESRGAANGSASANAGLLNSLDQELAAIAGLEADLDPEAQALIALKAFQHIDLAA